MIYMLCNALCYALRIVKGSTMSRSMVGRLFVVLAIAFAFVAPVASVQAKAYEPSYAFVSNDGSVILSDAHLALWDARDGDYEAKLTIVPTQEEIDSLLSVGSHVDFVFTFHGLERTGGGSNFAPAVSDDVRQVGAVVEDGPSGTVYRALGLNIEKRWNAGEAITVLAPIFGYEPYAHTYVSVDLISSEWQFADGSCEVAYQRETNGILLQYCRKDKGLRATLIDENGYDRFPF